MDIEEFFSRWDQKCVAAMSEEQKQSAYNDYQVKHYVFNRDNFECQIDGCDFNDSPLTLHHFKHRSNGGKTSIRNCVTVCRAHQNKYHSGKKPLSFRDAEHLPNHIQKATQALDRYVNGRTTDEKPRILLRVENRKWRSIRKEHRDQWNRRLSIETILMLFAWLFKN